MGKTRGDGWEGLDQEEGICTREGGYNHQDRRIEGVKARHGKEDDMAGWKKVWREVEGVEGGEGKEGFEGREMER